MTSILLIQSVKNRLPLILIIKFIFELISVEQSALPKCPNLERD